MSKGNVTENDFMLYTFNATAFSWNALTDLYVALHTADPGETGTATTNETSYGGYARATVPRSNIGFTVSNNTARNTALVQFPQCTSGSAMITHVSIVTTSSGAGQILYKGALDSPLAVSTGIQPQFAANELEVTED